MRVLLLALALLGTALAGCLAPASQPLQPTAARTVGGSVEVPDVAVEGAEVVQHADAVEIIWREVARPAATLALPVLGNPLGGLAGFAVTKEFPLPVEVTQVEASLTWTNADTNLNLVVRDEDGRTQCRSVNGVEDEPATERCRVVKAAPRAGEETWGAFVQIVQNLRTEESFELRLNLSVRPFPLLGPALVPELRSPALAFFTARVDEERRTGEPSLKVDGQGNVYIAAPTGRMQSLWRTSDGGQSFEWLDILGNGGPVGAAWAAAGRGGGDAEVFVTPDGSEVYFADLYGTCFTVGSSMDQGASWHVNPASCDVPYGNDRQWIWAQPGGHLWMAYNGFVPFPASMVADARGLTLLHSIDGGKTWPFRVQVPEDACARGNLAVDAEARWYVGGCNDDGPGVAIGEPGAGAYRWVTVAERSGEPLDGFCYVCAIFTVVDLDAEGNAYVVWADPSADEEGFDLWLSTSTDQGASWSTPVMVNKADGNAVLPWIAAGEPGQVAIAWYQTAAKGAPSDVQGEWYAHLAVSRNALDAAPTFEEALVQEEPVQYGPICLRGSGCQGARNLLDFLMVDIDAQGLAHLAYNDGTHGGSAGNSFVMYARQLAGAAPAS